MKSNVVFAMIVGCVAAMPGPSGTKLDENAGRRPKSCGITCDSCTDGNYSEKTPDEIPCAHEYE